MSCTFMNMCGIFIPFRSYTHGAFPQDFRNTEFFKNSVLQESYGSQSVHNTITEYSLRKFRMAITLLIIVYPK